MKLVGLVNVKHVRKGKVIREFTEKNLLTKFGALQFIYGAIGVTVGGVGWNVGLIDGAFPIALSIDDTLASHPGWTQQQGLKAPGLFSAGAIQPSRKTGVIIFTFSGDEIIGGAFMVSISTSVGVVPGRIISELEFAAPVEVDANDQLHIQITITLV